MTETRFDLMDSRTTERVPSGPDTVLHVGHSPHDGMWRVYAEVSTTSTDRHRTHIVWEPSLMHLPTQNNEEEALRVFALYLERTECSSLCPIPDCSEPSDGGAYGTLCFEHGEEAAYLLAEFEEFG